MISAHSKLHPGMDLSRVSKNLPQSMVKLIKVVHPTSRLHIPSSELRLALIISCRAFAGMHKITEAGN
jgi:hypothetical protein